MLSSDIILNRRYKDTLSDKVCVVLRQNPPRVGCAKEYTIHIEGENKAITHWRFARDLEVLP